MNRKRNIDDRRMWRTGLPLCCWIMLISVDSTLKSFKFYSIQLVKSSSMKLGGMVSAGSHATVSEMSTMSFLSWLKNQYCLSFTNEWRTHRASGIQYPVAAVVVSIELINWNWLSCNQLSQSGVEEKKCHFEINVELDSIFLMLR